MKIRTLLALLLFTCPSILSAQPPTVATATQSFGFDYKDADLTTFTVIRFEMAIDPVLTAGVITSATWSSVAIPPKANDAQTPAGSSTFKVPIPALTTGNHSVSFRACNAQVCGDASTPTAFVLAVKPPTPGPARILGNP